MPTVPTLNIVVVMTSLLELDEKLVVTEMIISCIGQEITNASGLVEVDRTTLVRPVTGTDLDAKLLSRNRNRLQFL